MNIIFIIIIVILFSLIILQFYFYHLKYINNKNNIFQLEKYENNLKSSNNYKLDLDSIKNLLSDYYKLKS